MKLAATVALAVLWGVALCAFAETRAERMEPIEPTLPGGLRAIGGCGDALLISTDTYHFTNASGGHSGEFDWIHCDSPAFGYTLGTSTHAVADSRWQLARVGITLRPRAELIFYVNANAGAGNTAGNNFDYVSLTDGAIIKTAEQLHLKVEHQFFRIGAVRGNLLRVAGIVALLPTVTAEISVARSFAGNLLIRSNAVRVDWDTGSARPFAGAALGRQIPQAFEAASAAASPDFTNRQWFAGATVPFGRYDWIVAIDNQRGEATSRRTVTVALKFTFK